MIDFWAFRGRELERARISLIPQFAFREENE